MTRAADADDVVVVGLACRFPDAHHPQQLWQNVLGRRTSFRPIPPERLSLAEYGGPSVDQTYVTRAAVLDGWVFDRHRFRVPGGTYRSADLTHWLALDVTADALADAGFADGGGLDGHRVGVVLGNSLTGEFSRAASLRTRWPFVRRALVAALADAALSDAERTRIVDDAERRFKAPFPAPSDETLAGALSNTIAGRICNHFDFHGTGYTVDAACASSLVAIGAAAGAVAAGQLDVALAGGVDLSLDPFELVGFARVDALARGDMRIYDARPTGFLPGEGCGIVVLCRRAFAVEHDLRPYATVLGWATSSDGSGGLTRPESAGQRLALERAYACARIDPSAVALVEGHGTGTAVGDAAELQTLLSLRVGAESAPLAALGSVKANIGHTKAAAGVAGFIKAVLAVHHEILPPTTGCEEPHPLLSGTDATVGVRPEAQTWGDRHRYSGVSAMGFGGINAHVVLGGVSPSTRRRLSFDERRLAAPRPDYEVVVCTADGPGQLAAALEVVRSAAGQLSRAELTDLAAAMAAADGVVDPAARGGGPPAMRPVRFAAAVRNAEELATAAGYALQHLAAGGNRIVDPARRVFMARTRRPGEPPSIGLLFSGQAAPVYPDGGAVGRAVAAGPPLRADSDADADPPSTGTGARTGRPGVDRFGTAVAQPAITRCNLSGLRWLDVLGVRATHAVGHSLGELSALVWAGALAEADAHRLASARGAAMAAASDEPAGMASIAADLATVERLVDGSGAVVAADNGDRQVVVSGPRGAVAETVGAAATRGIAVQWLPVRHAFHSPLMAPAADPLRRAAARMTWTPLARTVVSTVTGAPWADGDDPVDILVRQLTGPVRFREAVAHLDVDMLVEVGPGGILADLVRAAGLTAVALDAGAPSSAGLATTTAALYALGACDTVTPYFSGRFTRPFDLRRPRQFLANPCEQNASIVRSTVDSAEPVGTPATADPAVAPASVTDPLGVVLDRVAHATELDAATIDRHARLLADLHLSSLRVMQIAVEVADVLGRSLAAAPLVPADGTVDEFAAVLAALPEAAGSTSTLEAASWIRAFGHHAVPTPPPAAAPVVRDWTIVGDLAWHPLADEIRARFPSGRDGARTRLLVLPPGLQPLPVAAVVEALRASDADGCPLVVVHHGGVGGAVGRSLVAERQGVDVLVLDVPADPHGIGSASVEAHLPWRGYAEARYRDGSRTETVVRPMEISSRDDAAVGLGPTDLCLVSGGGRGIGAECALTLAATGAPVVLLGRSPADDVDVRAVLSRAAGAGLDVRYHRVDVCDPAATAVAVRSIQAGSGPVRSFVHAAGHNEPARLSALTAADIEAAIAPKVTGFEHVLGALDLTELRHVITFGSVIGSIGLPGAAAYAIANDWLARRCADLAAGEPGVRWLNIEWSAWSGTGMAVRLGALDTLIRQGVSPIPVDTGTRTLMRLLATPALPSSVIVAGRLPATPTLRWDDPGTADGRFAQPTATHTPGVELVVEPALSMGTDPYLADHRIDTVAVLPAVFGLEAMAQAATALGEKPVPAVIANVTFDRPVTIPERDDRILRVTALAREDGGVDVAIRSAESGFAADHMTGTYRSPSADRPSGAPPPDALTATPPVPVASWYGPLYFHGPRFRRVLGYHALTAERCVAAIATDHTAAWFGGFVDQRLRLGDPGARDAYLHVLQACVPDRRVLPVGVGRVTVHALADGPVVLDARQRAVDGDTFTFDLTVTGTDGTVVEEWQDLALRAVGPVRLVRPPLALLGPLLARELGRWPGAPRVDLGVVPADDEGRVATVASWLSDQAGAVSVDSLGSSALVATGAPGSAVCWCRVDGSAPGTPGAPGDRMAVAAVRELTGEDEHTVAIRLRTVRRLSPGPAPFVITGGGPPGWVAVDHGDARLFSRVVDADDGSLAVCVRAGGTG